MAFYLDSKRIPPERLVFNQPENYDRMMKTTDIDGAKANVKPPQVDLHGNSLRVKDIPGAQSKQTIRSLWKDYDYNPLEKSLMRNSEIEGIKKTRGPTDFQQLAQSYVQEPIEKRVPVNPYQDLDKKPFNPAFLAERIHKVPLEPKSQIKEQIILKPADVLQQNRDYDKIIQPYMKPEHDKRVYETFTRSQMDLQKHGKVREQMTQISQIQDKNWLFDRKRVAEVASNLKQDNNFQKDYENFYKGSTPNQQSIQNYQFAQKMLEKQPNYNKLQQQLSQPNLQQNNSVPYFQQQQQQYQPSQNQQQSIQQNQSYAAQYQSQPSNQQYQQYQNNQNQFDQQQNYQQNIQQSQSMKNFGYNQNYQQNNQQHPQGTKEWKNHDYNIVGNYIRDKREYDRSGFATAIEKEYYQNYDSQKQEQMRKTRIQAEKQKNITEMNPNYIQSKNSFYGTQEPKQIRLKQNELDFNEVQEIQRQKISNNFGRSSLFKVDNPHSKISSYPARNYTHDKNFRGSYDKDIGKQNWGYNYKNNLKNQSDVQIY